MNLNKGDRVVHSTFGIGKVVTIEAMSLNSAEPRMFYRIDFIKTTIWIAVGEPSTGRLRPITPKSQLDQYRAVLKTSPATLDDDFRKRRIELEKRMDGGSFRGLCEVTRDLNALNSQKPLNYSEKKFLEQTQDALVLEWSTASEITRVEAMSEINGCMSKGKQV